MKMSTAKYDKVVTRKVSSLLARLSLFVIVFLFAFSSIGIASNALVHDTPYEAYNKKIAEYIAAISMDDEEFESMHYDYSSINWGIVSYAHMFDEVVLAYSLYDIDGDGIPELIFSDLNSVIDIYTLRNNKLVKVYDNCSFGDRSYLYILSDGFLMTEGANDAFSASCEFFAIDAVTGKTTDTIVSFYYDTNGPQDYYGDAIYTDVETYNYTVDLYVADSIFDRLEWTFIEEDHGSIFLDFYTNTYGADGSVYAFRDTVETEWVTDQDLGYDVMNAYEVLYSDGYAIWYYIPLDEDGNELPIIYAEYDGGLTLVSNSSQIDSDADVSSAVDQSSDNSVFHNFYINTYGSDGSVYCCRDIVETVWITDQDLGYDVMNAYEVLSSDGYAMWYYIPLDEDGNELPIIYAEYDGGLTLVSNSTQTENDDTDSLSEAINETDDTQEEEIYLLQSVTTTYSDGINVYFEEYSYDSQARLVQQTTTFTYSYEDTYFKHISCIINYTLDENGYRTMATKTTYNGSGKVNNVYYCEFINDEEGRCIQKNEYNADGTRELIDMYEYDDMGNVISCYRSFNSNRIDSKMLIYYNENGWEVSRVVNNIKYRNDWTTTDVEFVVTDEYIYDYEYDSDGNVIRSKLYNSDGELQSETEYDTNGNIIRSVHYTYSPEREVWYREEYKYFTISQ